MMNFDRKYLLPTDLTDLPLLMWTYTDGDQRHAVAYGTIKALVADFDMASNFGDDGAPDKVWAVTHKGPMAATVKMSASHGGTTVRVSWHDPLTSGNVITVEGWYERKDV